MSMPMNEIDIADDDALRFVQRVLESDAPESDRMDARNMVVAIRTRVRKEYAQRLPPPPAVAQAEVTDDAIHDLAEKHTHRRECVPGGHCHQVDVVSFARALVAVREPLTEETIAAAFTGEPHTGVPFRVVVQIARAIERAHGIQESGNGN
jgi:hypothetical protein